MVSFVKQIQSKYDVTQAHEALEWVSDMIGEQFNTSGDMDNVYEQLKDGRKLCQYVLIFQFILGIHVDYFLD